MKEKEERKREREKIKEKKSPSMSSIEKKCTFVLNSYCHSILTSHGKSPSHSAKQCEK